MFSMKNKSSKNGVNFSNVWFQICIFDMHLTISAQDIFKSFVITYVYSRITCNMQLLPEIN